MAPLSLGEKFDGLIDKSRRLINKITKLIDEMGIRKEINAIYSLYANFYNSIKVKNYYHIIQRRDRLLKEKIPENLENMTISKINVY